MSYLEEPAKNIILKAVKSGGIADMPCFSNMISDLCSKSGKTVVLMIDEADQANNHKVFLDFLGMLRSKFLKRNTRPTFQSVILAGVYDIKNLRQRIRENCEHQYNSPWNIAADFCVDISFTIEDIQEMLAEYVEEINENIPVHEVAEEIYKYTSGYPYLVSKICKLIRLYNLFLSEEMTVNITFQLGERKKNRFIILKHRSGIRPE